MMTQSRQSKPASQVKEQKTSTTSWTNTPEPGDVISYAYLWHREKLAGHEDGLKDRPCVVVVAQQIVGGKLQLHVAPITHSPPQASNASVEMPQRIKRELGLDSERSWIVTSELNRFFWPGPDIRPVQHKDGWSPYFGAIPAKLLAEVKSSFLAIAKQGKIRMVGRTE